MLKKVIFTLVAIVFIGTLFSFQNKPHSKALKANSNLKIQEIPPVEMNPPRIKIKSTYGAIDLGNNCLGDWPCGPCWAYCHIIIIVKQTADASGYGGTEILGEYIDETHFKFIFDNATTPEIVNHPTFNFPNNVLMNSPVLQEVFNKNSIEILAGSYTVMPGEGNTSIVVANSITL